MCLNATAVRPTPTVHYRAHGAMLLSLAIAIVISNTLLLCSLVNQKRNRTNIMFIILSASDLLVGLLSLPLRFLFFIGVLQEESRMLEAFFDIGPPAFSWVMTIIISAERCVVVTHPRLHEKFGKFFFNILIIISFIVVLSASIHKMNVGYWSDNFSQCLANFKEITTWYTFQIAIEFFLFSTAGLLQLYLLYHIKKKFRALENNRHSASDHGTRVTKSIRLLFLCLVVCYVPHIGAYTIMKFRLIHITSGVYYFYFDNMAVFFVYFNSLFNSIILLTRSTNIKRQRDQLVKVIREKIRSFTSKE